ncbi:MAG: acylphosphatase [Candidatus Promineifilaceae bacterium]|nr:acylphosphatase [Candidatus Promineifilaceae bacterium]
MKRLEATMSGRVQGVSFRYYTRREARRLGLTGWVRNEPDGTVQVVAEGSEEDLEALLNFLRDGPPAARVQNVDASWASREQQFSSFQIVR